jgi:hypothetical protein
MDFFSMVILGCLYLVFWIFMFTHVGIKVTYVDSNGNVVTKLKMDG